MNGVESRLNWRRMCDDLENEVVHASMLICECVVLSDESGCLSRIGCIYNGEMLDCGGNCALVKSSHMVNQFAEPVLYGNRRREKKMSWTGTRKQVLKIRKEKEEKSKTKRGGKKEGERKQRLGKAKEREREDKKAETRNEMKESKKMQEREGERGDTRRGRLIKNEVKSRKVEKEGRGRKERKRRGKEQREEKKEKSVARGK
ncbi:hypothetical protein Tco_0364367 [Tanacetum coccineum]